MRISNIKAYACNMALTKPYTIAFETVTAVENVFLEIELDNGIRGVGAASPSLHVIGETLEDSTRNLQSDALQQLLVGQDIRRFRQLILEARALFAHHTAGATAVDIALHDAFGRFIDLPVVDFYGRRHRSMPTSVTIGIMNVADTLAEAAAFKSMGFQILKIKTGLNIEEDIERCVKVRERFGNHFRIRIDANQGYDSDQTIRFFEATRHLGLELIEQPLPADAVAALKALPPAVRAAVACDESLHDAASAFQLAAPPAAGGIFNIKLMKCGGLLGAFDIANIAEAAGIDLFWGCFDESIVSITAALHAAFACPRTRYLDLDGSLDLAEDLVQGGFMLEGGSMRIGPGAGFGYELL